MRRLTDIRRFLPRIDIRRLLHRVDVRRLPRWYGAGPLHLLTMLACFALAGFAVTELLPINFVGIPIWLAGAVIGHDLILMPLYTLADRSAIAIFRHRRPELPAVPWINYLRIPAGLSALLLLIWFPLILRLPAAFPRTTTLPLDPYLWHWLGVTGALFLLSAIALAVRLGRVHRAAKPRRSRRAAAASGQPGAHMSDRGAREPSPGPAPGNDPIAHGLGKPLRCPVRDDRRGDEDNGLPDHDAAFPVAGKTTAHLRR